MKKIDNISDTYLMDISAIQVGSDGVEVREPLGRLVQPSDDVICGRSDYCISHKIPLFPYDVWHLVNSYDGRAGMGLKDTTDLYDEKNPILEIRYNGRRPVAYTNLKKCDGVSICPFAKIKDGKVECMVSSVKPMVCRLNPLTVKSKLNSNVVTWDYYIPFSDIDVDEPIKVKEAVWGCIGLIQAMNENARAMGIVSAYGQRGLDRESMGQLMFNFDAPLKYGRIGEGAKIDSFEGLMKANFFVMQMLLGSKKHEDKKGK